MLVQTISVSAPVTTCTLLTTAAWQAPHRQHRASSFPALQLGASATFASLQACLQVGDACAAAPGCFFYRLEDRPGSLQHLRNMPGVPEATRALGYADFADFSKDARPVIEASYLLSTFCLTPPGDSPKRKGFYDAFVFGCVLLACAGWWM
jgi:hypothetical protein